MKKTIVLILFLIGIVLAQIKNTETDVGAPTCPGGGICNGHGSCNNGQCSCSKGWGGDDCSFLVTEITSGVPATAQHIESRQWHFYYLNVNAGNGLMVIVNQTSISGDVDLYVLVNDFPTKSHYAQREISTSKNFALFVPNPTAGTWYIGIFGFLITDYTITVSVTSSNCPEQNNCNPPNGICISKGVCQCNPGWGNTDCSTVVKEFNLGQTYSNSLVQRTWAYYTTSITKSNSLKVFVDQSGGDVDLYIKFGRLPTLWIFDYRDASTAKNFTISINEPQLGSWYFGFYAYTSTNFTFISSVSNQCPSNCSNHGICRAAACQCQSSYNGVFCQNMIFPMALGSSYPGFVESNSWNYFFVQANTENSLLINLQETNEGDCDVYLKQGSQPTKFSYDYLNIGTSSTVQITVSEPTGTWYIGIYGYSTCSYILSANIINSCPGNPPCSGHGSCTSQGICQCNTGFVGTNCSLAVRDLGNGNTLSNQNINLNSWKFYQLSVINTTFVSVGIKETSTVGFLWLYVSKGSSPDMRNYDFADLGTNSQYHSVQITFNNPQTDILIIGVYTNPFALHSPISFSIAAWYAPF